jgi:serine/threonine protein phosphatase PrpC
VTDHQDGWLAFGHSVRGAAHVLHGLPNQDAIALSNGLGGRGAAVAVADGHGNPIHFRSETGAQLAVRSALEVLEDFSPEAVDDLPSRIVDLWRREVEDHRARNPYQPGEASSGPLVPYGTTLLAVVARRDWVLYLQLGDGDILTVDDQGRAGRPLPPDPSLDGVHTTSLCQDDAAQRTRVRVVRGPRPALIAVCTDGYANSYSDDRAFLQIGPDYLKLIQENAADLEHRLEEILNHVSRAGSSDDVTLGLLARGIEVKVLRRPRNPRWKTWMLASGAAAMLLAAAVFAAHWWQGPPPPPLPHPPQPPAEAFRAGPVGTPPRAAPRQ